MNTLKAEEGKYLTQVGEVNDRVFIDTEITGVNATTEYWRTAEPEEKENYSVDNSILENKIKEIKAYDSSSAVNGFYLGGQELWIASEDRLNLSITITKEKNSGREYTTIWSNGQSFTLPCVKALQLLDALTIYAHDCYNVTAQHIANVSKMGNYLDIQKYNYKTGYPPKLEF